MCFFYPKGYRRGHLLYAKNGRRMGHSAFVFLFRLTHSAAFKSLDGYGKGIFVADDVAIERVTLHRLAASLTD